MASPPYNKPSVPKAEPVTSSAPAEELRAKLTFLPVPTASPEPAEHSDCDTTQPCPHLDNSVSSALTDLPSLSLKFLTANLTGQKGNSPQHGFCSLSKDSRQNFHHILLDNKLTLSSILNMASISYLKPTTVSSDSYSTSVLFYNRQLTSTMEQNIILEIITSRIQGIFKTYTWTLKPEAFGAYTAPAIWPSLLFATSLQ